MKELGNKSKAAIVFVGFMAACTLSSLWWTWSLESSDLQVIMCSLTGIPIGLITSCVWQAWKH